MRLIALAGASHFTHSPWIDLSDGAPGVQHPEQPARLAALLGGLERLGAEIHAVHGFGDSARALASSMHDAGYLAFLERACAALTPARQITPTLFGVGGPSAPLDVQAGRYCREIGTPITFGAFEAAMNAAEATRQGAERLLAAAPDERIVVATRPPGHHAAPARFAGYCYLNNAALAARALENAGRRVAILDVDYHLGDGTLEFATPARRYYSIHADFYANYPYLAPEHGVDAAAASLSALTDDDDAASVIAKTAALVAEINASDVDAVVLSLGFDLNGQDVIQDLKLGFAVSDFVALGRAVGGLRAPILSIFEGGYDLATLGACVEAFFRGLDAALR